MQVLKIHSLLAIALLLFFVAGCPSGGDGTETTGGDSTTSANGNTGADTSASLPEVRVAIPNWPGLGPFFLAHHKGFDKEEGVIIKAEISHDTNGRRVQLQNGEMDLIGITLDSVLIAKSRGMDMVIVGQSDMSYGGDAIIATDKYQSVADLRGQKVAYAEGSPSEAFLLYLLDQHGMKKSDIELVPADEPGQAAIMFATEQVDVAVSWEPDVTMALDTRPGHVLASTRDVPEKILGIVTASGSWIDQKADNIYRAMKAWDKAVAYMHENKEESYALMAEDYGLDVETFTAIIEGAKIADVKEALRVIGTTAQPGEIAIQLTEDFNRIFSENGIIDQPVAPADLINYVVMDKLAADLAE
ncbi:ABC transporter substrate-binding protein [bacterium]|nr:ABC transporter substrate-binding protein [bacterium]